MDSSHYLPPIGIYHDLVATNVSQVALKNPAAIATLEHRTPRTAPLEADHYTPQMLDLLRSENTKWISLKDLYNKIQQKIKKVI